jgi:hypothetical protein
MKKENKMKKIIILIIITMFFLSCFKDDRIIVSTEDDSVKKLDKITITMDYSYKYTLPKGSRILKAIDNHYSYIEINKNVYLFYSTTDNSGGYKGGTSITYICTIDKYKEIIKD